MLEVADTDTASVIEARAGKAAGWDALFQRYQLPLYAYLRELTHDEQTALDLVQESFIAAAKHLHTLRDDARFGSWLFGIAHQKCIQHWRKRRLDVEPLEEHAESLPADANDPQDWLIQKEQEEQFMKAIGQLPLVQREALLLHFVEDFPLEEIAAITGAGLGTVKSRLHYAKKALRKILEEAQ